MPDDNRVSAWLNSAVGRMRDPSPRGGVRVEPRPLVGLALSGGFARGIAHIGVLRVLEEHHIPVDCISGTSVGALIGAAYASGTSLDDMAMQAGTTRFSDFGRWTLSRMGLASNQRLEEFMTRYTRAKRFEDLKVPLAIAATDLGSGTTVHFTTGDLALAVRASCAYPGLFLPVEHRGRSLVDGFVTSTVPIEGARELGAEVVIAVHLHTGGLAPKPRTMFEVIGRTFSILQESSEVNWRKQCEVLIEPGVSDVMWDEFDKTPQLIAVGEAAARMAIPAIRVALTPRRRKGDLPRSDADRARRA
jgi:NTE family protein